MTERTGVSGAVRRTRKHERDKCMKAMCLHCRNGEPAEIEREPASNITYWVHGPNQCAAGPIRDREAASHRADRHGECAPQKSEG
jgi:hypothetical protein